MGGAVGQMGGLGIFEGQPGGIWGGGGLWGRVLAAGNWGGLWGSWGGAMGQLGACLGVFGGAMGQMGG